MELKIELTTCNACDNCKVTIQDNSTYLSEDTTSVVKGKFKFSDTVSIDILQLNKSSETQYLSPTYTNHSSLNPTTLQVDKDGWFSLIHLVLPSKEWFDKEKEKEQGSALGLYNIVYYIDNNDKIHKYINGQVSEVELKEVIEINPIDTTISKISQDFVSICYIRKCYINLCKQIFESRGFSSCWTKNKIDSELIYKRDLVWMAINVITYYTECEQLAEVERIIETINGCNGLCSSISNTNKSNSCGCSN